jgi:adenine deaminase
VLLSISILDPLFKGTFFFTLKYINDTMCPLACQIREVDVKGNKGRVQEIGRLMRTALGEEKVDMVILDGALVNVYTGEIQEPCSVGVKGTKICSVGNDLRHLIGDGTHVINARGMYITPGFIDPHNHLDGIVQCAEYARYAVPHGNTTVVSESAMLANAAGRDGVNWFIDDSRGLPLRIFILTPSMIPPFPAFETSMGFSLADFQELITKDFVLGIGETYWPLVLDGDERAMTRYAVSGALGKTREGHAAGARGEKLIAYSAAGTSSDHEATTAEEALERLRLGMRVMIREGSVRRELEAVSAIKDMGVDLRGVMLCTDWADPQMLIEEGCMDELVRRAITSGFDPVIAIQMVTINPAEYFGLKELGGIAPGKIADLLILSDLREVVVATVIKDGRIVAKEGRLVKDPPRHSYPEPAYHTFALEGVQEEDFRISYEQDTALVRVIDAVNETITKEMQAELKVLQGNIPAQPERDILKMAHISKRGRRPQHALGFVHGLGIRQGAVAVSLIWDTSNILVIGATEREMAFAVNRLLAHQGGIIVVRGEQVVAELPLPICGVVSDRPLEEVARRIIEVEKACRALGCVPRPFLTLQTLPFTGLPHLRLTDQGLVDIRRRGFVDLIIS